MVYYWTKKTDTNMIQGILMFFTGVLWHCFYYKSLNQKTSLKIY